MINLYSQLHAVTPTEIRRKTDVLEDIACHVWAMGGEFDDSRARKMNTKYDEGAMLLMNGGQCADKFLNGLLKEAIAMGRTAPG